MKNGVSCDELAQLTSISTIPHHVAVIMDGNGRWAKGRGQARIEGHKQGANTVRLVVEEARRLGVKVLTLFTFSTENWGRPHGEVSSLMKLLKLYLTEEQEVLLKNGIRLRAIGERSALSFPVRKTLELTERKTASLDGMQLVLALSYGGRQELVQAARKLCERVAKGLLLPDDVDENCLRAFFYAPDLPDPDLLIRTSGQMRVSNFLLWQLAYTEIVVSDALWPDFSREEFNRCIAEFASRKRRFGLIDEQIEERSPVVMPAVAANSDLNGELSLAGSVHT